MIYYLLRRCSSRPCLELTIWTVYHAVADPEVTEWGGGGTTLRHPLVSTTGTIN